MFSQSSNDGYLKPLEGVQMKTLVHGEKTLMVEFRTKRGGLVPLHNHPHEQTGYLVSGKVRFSVGSEAVICNPGDSWCIPANEEHRAESLEDSVLIEVFSPVREDYLPK